MSDNRLNEILEEFRTVTQSRGNTMDAVMPSLVFVIANAIGGLTTAIWAALGIAVVLFVLRLLRKQPWKYALFGLGGVALAIGLSLFTQQAQNFFLPAIITSGLTLLACFVTLIIRRPLAALSSHISRNWPLVWYQHEKVRPAYSEVTWMWTALFALRLATQIALYLSENAAELTWANLLLGWPVTVGVLVISYFYGTRRLKKLGGPSVEEFTQNAPTPWEGQKRGF
jgi:Protein of unknown function (DUF3159)